MTIKIASPGHFVNIRAIFRPMRGCATSGAISVAALAFFAMSGGTAGAQSAGSPSMDTKLDSPFAAFRIGVITSPVASIDTGLDVTFPRLRIGRSWVSRFDLDLSARFNSRSFGSRRDAEIAPTFCQVYTPGGVNRGRFFAGAGIGPWFGPRSGFGGKVFAGINFTPVVSVEVEGQFPPSSAARLAVMVRLSAL
jgi:hypothetical protein